MIKMIIEVWEESGDTEEVVFTKVHTPVCTATGRELAVAKAIFDIINGMKPPGSIHTEILVNKTMIRPIPGTEGNPEDQ